MAFAGNCGVNVNISSKNSLLDTLFSEELGWIIEVEEDDLDYVMNAYKNKGICCHSIGFSTNQDKNSQIMISVNSENVLDQPMVILRDLWEETSFQLERRQTNNDCVEEEQQGLKCRKQPEYHLSFDIFSLQLCNTWRPTGPRVAVIREEGINGDREMNAALFMAGFTAFDVTMTDLLTKKVTLGKFQGVVFPGGFSYADVLGSARGWAASFLFHPDIEAEFTAFKTRPDTFSLGVCNGCQLMALLGWVGSTSDDEGNIVPGVTLGHNKSERFESRFVAVKIEDSPSIMLKDMENSILGVWVAHGEGQFQFKNSDVFDHVMTEKLAPLLYVNDNSMPTNEYPFNPNGSIGGIASVCSEDGRHLAMMPHPERCVLPWQWAWMPEDWKSTMTTVSPWLKMFTNAYEWCCRKR